MFNIMLASSQKGNCNSVSSCEKNDDEINLEDVVLLKMVQKNWVWNDGPVTPSANAVLVT